MTPNWHNRPLLYSDKFYRGLLLIYPRPYRDAYGPPMAQLFRDQCRDAWCQSRAWGLLVLWLRSTPDLIRTSILEHIANWKGRKSMTDNIAALTRPRRAPVGAFLGVAIVVFLVTFIASAVVTFLMPESFASYARLKIEPDPPTGPIGSGQASVPSHDPYFLKTQLEVMRSEVILGKVIEKLDLNTAWGKRYGGGEKLKTSETLAILKSRIETRSEPGTSLAEIRAYSESPEEAARVANMVAEAYKEHRLQYRVAVARGDLEAMNEQYALQEQKVRDAQQEVDRLRKELKVADFNSSSEGPQSSLDADVIRRLRGELVSYDTLLAEKRNQLKLFIQLSPEQRREAMQVAIGADPEFGKLVQEANQADSQLITLQYDHSTNHPAYLSAVKLAKDARSHVDARLEGVLLGLSNRVNQLEAARDTVKKNLDEAQATDFARTEMSRPYFDAKARLKEMDQFRSALATQLATKRVDMSMPNNLVEIIDRAMPGLRPVRPDKARNLLYGACAGALLALFIGSFTAWLISLGRNAPPSSRITPA